MATVTDQQAKQLIATNLRRFRGDLSLAEVARRCDSYPTTIKEIEEGRRMPGVGLLTRIAESLEVEIADFLKPARKTSRSA